MTLKKLRERCVFWQDLLNLKEWSITVRRPVKGDPKGNEGMAFWWTERLEAEVVITNGYGEEVLVHELIHIVFDGHQTYDPADYSELHERAINRTAAAFIKLTNLPT